MFRVIRICVISVLLAPLASAAGPAPGPGVINAKPEYRSFADAKAAADMGNVRAMLEMAYRCEQGAGTQKSPADAAIWLAKAAEKNSAEAQCVLGYRLLTGTGVAKDEAMGAQLLTKSADQGNLTARFELAMAHMNGNGLPKNETKAHEQLLLAAQKGHTRAMGEVGQDFLLARGTPEDLAAATTWLRKAADLNDPVSQRRLAEMLRDGKGTDKDLKQSFSWFQRAANGGDVESMWQVAQMYKAGDGVGRDPDRASIWLKRLSEQGHEAAQRELGQISPGTYQQLARNLTFKGSELVSKPGFAVQAEGKVTEMSGGKWTLAVGPKGAERKIAVDTANIKDSKVKKGHTVRVFGILRDATLIEGVTHILPPASYKFTYTVKPQGAIVSGSYTSFIVSGTITNDGPQPITKLVLDVNLSGRSNGNHSEKPVTLQDFAPGQVKPYSVTFSQYTWYSRGNSLPRAEIKEKSLDW